MSRILTRAVLLAMVATPGLAAACGSSNPQDPTCFGRQQPEARWYLGKCIPVLSTPAAARNCRAAGGSWVVGTSNSTCEELHNPPHQAQNTVYAWWQDQSNSMLSGYAVQEPGCELVSVSAGSDPGCGAEGPVMDGSMVVLHRTVKNVKYYREIPNPNGPGLICANRPSDLVVSEDWLVSEINPVGCPAGSFAVMGPGSSIADCQRVLGGMCNVGNPVDPANGEKRHTEATLLGISLSSLLKLHYRSYGDWGAAGVEGLVGRYWRFEFDRRIGVYNADTIILYMGGREPAVFKKNLLGVYYPLHVTNQRAMKVTFVGGIYTLTDSDLSTWRFDSNGRVMSMFRPNGHGFAASWGSNSVELIDQDGRIVKVSFVPKIENLGTMPPFSNGTLIDVADMSGQAVSIVSRLPGVVTSISTSSGTREFQYTDANFRSGLTGIKDELGRLHRVYTYDSRKRVANEYIVPSGTNVPQYSYTYNYSTSSPLAAGSITITNPLNQVSTAYSVVVGGVRRLEHQAENCVDCGGSTAMYNTYFPNGNLESSVDLKGVRSEFLWNSRNLEIQRIEAKSAPGVANPAVKRTIQTDWHTTHALPTEKRFYNAQNVLEQTRAWTYDSVGNTTAECVYDPQVSSPAVYACGSQSHAPAGVRQTRYQIECTPAENGGCLSTGKLLSIDGPRTDVSDTTSFSYYTSDDPSCATYQGECLYREGDLQTVTNALGHTTTYVSYDKAGRLTGVRDSSGILTEHVYDSRGRIHQTIVRADLNGAPSSDDEITEVSYELFGEVKRVTQPDGSYLEYGRDSAHRIVGLTDNLGNQIIYTLDAAGNRTLETTKDAQNNIKRLLGAQYDGFSRLKFQVNARYAAMPNYDVEDVKKTRHVYDMNGNLDELIDPLGRKTDFDHDELNRVKKTVQDKRVGGINATTLIEYDTRDNVRKVTDPKGLETIYIYDGLDNLVQLESPDTGTTSYTHDAAGNVLTQTDARNVTVTMTYDELGRIVTMVFPDATLNRVFTYDVESGECKSAQGNAIGLLSSMTDGSGATSYCYDWRGRVVSKTQTGPSATYTTGYEYTKTGRLASVTYPSGGRARYDRDVTGRVVSVHWRESDKHPEDLLVSSISYLPFGPMSEIVWSYGAVQSRIHDQDYWIDAINSTLPTGLQADFTLDDSGNITTITTGAEQRGYQYDGLYRLIHQQNIGLNIRNYTYDATGNRLSFSTDELGSNQSYIYPANSHRLQSIGGTARDYDANGNLTHPSLPVLSGRTYSYSDSNRLDEVALNGLTTATFRYNARGERTVKERTVENGRIYDFVFDETGHLIGEYSDQSLSTLGEYVWVDDLPVAVIYDGKAHAIETDQLGTPRRVMNNLSAVWSWDLLGDPFGNTAPNEDPDGDASNFVFNLRFPGQYYDQDTKLNYNYIRDYESGTGRYAESDPIGLDGGVSTYAYAGGDPILNMDEFGLLSGNSTCFGLDPRTCGRVKSTPLPPPLLPPGGCKQTWYQCFKVCGEWFSKPFIVAGGITAGKGISSAVKGMSTRIPAPPYQKLVYHPVWNKPIVCQLNSPMQKTAMRTHVGLAVTGGWAIGSLTGCSLVCVNPCSYDPRYEWVWPWEIR